MNEKKHVIMSRLSIEVSNEEHQQIKALAALDGKSIREYVMERVLPVSKQNDAWSKLQILLRERVNEAIHEPASSKTISQITEEEIDLSLR